ncbi:MAG: peroxiredoxin [Candidatus Puniceispirillum sp.]|nr:peroxiredoxin [Candidatus Pelagibacter sp.]MBA4283457.1 peroxiredoxin [Candidatus Puniceispirillum sp.]
MPEIKPVIPNLPVCIIKEGKQEVVKLHTLLDGKRTVLFGLPGAFTPICSNQHLPEFIKKSNEIYESKIDQIICMSVNDPFVMNAWREQIEKDQPSKIIFLCDTEAVLTKELGLQIDLSGAWLGIRCERFVILLDQAEIKKLLREEKVSDCIISSAQSVLDIIKKDY